MQKKRAVAISLFSELIFALCPFFTQAQYSPHKETCTSSVSLSSYITNGIEMIVIFITVYAMFILLIASILYITSGGDEDRMDTAILWTKYSAFSIIIAMIIYFGAGSVVGFLFELSA